jgi:hypothetical protein
MKGSSYYQMLETPTRPQVKCPQCGTPITPDLISIVDVGQHPELREMLLGGRLNTATCPNCKVTMALDTPLVYHDAAQEFLGVYLPQQMNLPEMERQKIIGEMTQSLMRSLPPEQRKGYFLNPRQFMNRQSFMDAIMGTMGISQEELDRQRKRMKLLEQLMVMADDAKGLSMMVKGRDADIDPEFFILLGSLIDNAEQGGDGQGMAKLETLRQRLMEITTFGKRLAKREEAVASLEAVKTADELLEKVLAIDLDQATAVTLAARPLMDYTFFQKLTERLEASNGAEKDRLTKLREHLLNLTEQLDEQGKKAIERAVETLKAIVGDPNPRSAVRARRNELDDLFMNVLEANLQEAEKSKNQDAMRMLSMVWSEVMAIAQEALPPEVRLVNDLLQAPYPDGTRELLRQHKGEVTPEFLEVLDRLAEEMSENNGAAAKRLKDVKAQATLMV